MNSAKKNQVEEEDDFYGDRYICDLSHAPIDGNLKMEDNGSYAANSFLKEKCCKVCNKMFVGKKEESKKDLYVISKCSPCYLCRNTNCTFYICGGCYMSELVNGSNNGCSSRRNNWTK